MTGKPALAAFLKARLDEVEAAAKAAVRGPWRAMGRNVHMHGEGEKWWQGSPVIAECRYTTDDYTDPDDTAIHIALHDPGRALREVEAGRRILAMWQEQDGYDLPEGVYEGRDDDERMCDEEISDTLCEVIGILAAVSSDHPDYEKRRVP